MNWIRAILAVTISVWLPLLEGSAAASDVAFDPGSTVRAVTEKLEREHLSRKPLDDALSKLWLGTFLESLDPQRMYFLTADFLEFQQFEDRLDNLAKSGDFQFARLVRERYRQRTADAAADAQKLLSMVPDFSVAEECPVAFIGYATTREELRERWRLRLKAELLIEKLHGRQVAEVQSQLSARYQRISRQALDMNDQRLCEIFLNSLTVNYDRHSSYLYFTR